MNPGNHRRSPRGHFQGHHSPSQGNYHDAPRRRNQGLQRGQDCHDFRLDQEPWLDRNIFENQGQDGIGCNTYPRDQLRDNPSLSRDQFRSNHGLPRDHFRNDPGLPRDQYRRIPSLFDIPIFPRGQFIAEPRSLLSMSSQNVTNQNIDSNRFVSYDNVPSYEDGHSLPESIMPYKKAQGVNSMPFNRNHQDSRFDKTATYKPHYGSRDKEQSQLHRETYKNDPGRRGYHGKQQHPHHIWHKGEDRQCDKSSPLRRSSKKGYHSRQSPSQKRSQSPASLDDPKQHKDKKDKIKETSSDCGNIETVVSVKMTISKDNEKRGASNKTDNLIDKGVFSASKSHKCKDDKVKDKALKIADTSDNNSHKTHKGKKPKSHIVLDISDREIDCTKRSVDIEGDSENDCKNKKDLNTDSKVATTRTGLDSNKVLEENSVKERGSHNIHTLKQTLETDTTNEYDNEKRKHTANDGSTNETLIHLEGALKTNLQIESSTDESFLPNEPKKDDSVTNRIIVLSEKADSKDGKIASCVINTMENLKLSETHTEQKEDIRDEIANETEEQNETMTIEDQINEAIVKKFGLKPVEVCLTRCSKALVKESLSAEVDEHSKGEKQGVQASPNSTPEVKEDESKRTNLGGKGPSSFCAKENNYEEDDNLDLSCESEEIFTGISDENPTVMKDECIATSDENNVFSENKKNQTTVNTEKTESLSCVDEQDEDSKENVTVIKDKYESSDCVDRLDGSKDMTDIVRQGIETDAPSAGQDSDGTAAGVTVDGEAAGEMADNNEESKEEEATGDDQDSLRQDNVKDTVKANNGAVVGVTQYGELIGDVENNNEESKRDEPDKAEKITSTPKTEAVSYKHTKERYSPTTFLDFSDDSDEYGDDSDDDLLVAAPAFLESIKEIKFRPLPCTPEKANLSSSQSSDPGSQEQCADLQKIISKQSLQKFTLDNLLKEHTETFDHEQEMNTIKTELKADIDQGGFINIVNKAEEGEGDLTLGDEQKEMLNRLAVGETDIMEDRPGEEILSSQHYLCLFDGSLLPVHCGFPVKGTVSLIKHLSTVTPDQYERLLTTSLISMRFHHLPCQDAVVRWLFFLMSVETNQMTCRGCHARLQEILHKHHGKIKCFPGVYDFISVLVNFGASLETIIPKDLVSVDHVRSKLHQNKDYKAPSHNGSGDGVKMGGYQKKNLFLVLQIMTLAMFRKCVKMSAEELTLFIAVICKASLDKSLEHCCGVDEFQKCVAMAIKQYRDDDWLKQKVKLAEILPSLTVHHHNMASISELLPKSGGRIGQLQRVMGYLMLQKLLLGKTGTDIELEDVQIRDLYQFVGPIKELLVDNPYKLSSVVTILDTCVGINLSMNTREREELKTFIELANSIRARDHVSLLDRTRVKDKLVRLTSVWSLDIQTMKGKQTKIFEYTVRDSPVKMQIETLETSQVDEDGFSDSETEESNMPCKIRRLSSEKEDIT